MAITATAPRNGDDAADFSDFVGNEEKKLDLEEVIEPLTKYSITVTPHVFYPIRVGEVLNERYLVDRKIGSGGFSNVWMSHDLPDKKDVALKREFYLGDFGLVMEIGDTMAEHGLSPMQFCSPDRLHRKNPSFACTMWSYMIIFAELRLGYQPFPTWTKGGINAGITQCLVPLPEQCEGHYIYPGGLDSWISIKRPIQIMTLHQQFHTFVPKLIQLSENIRIPLCLESSVTAQRNV
ncbi:hypothetical protein ETB97_002801 [Aspergillus alliaceus]|uniref:Protein kinase domain-containing protein n=1 Tax=Petromyces alliaceus TaxID=209559 RepID=A0A8H6E601_PETAA|nr:hypothetical protein ETB97_002801 [Aspergillus burnettii]